MRSRLALIASLPLALALAGCGDDAASPSPPTVLATGQGAPRAVSADDLGVYWATGEGAVRELLHEEGQVRTIGDAQGEVVSVAADATRVYWMVGGAGGAMRHVNKAGTKDPAEVVADLDPPQGIGIDENCIFWVTPDAVMAIWKDGGELITVAADRTAPADVEVDFTGIYWIDGEQGGSIWRVEVEGDAPSLLTRAPGAQRLSLGPEHVFWTDDAGAVMRATKDGGDPETLSTGEGELGALTASGVDVYWLAQGGTQVRGFDGDSDGERAHTLADAQAGAVDIAIDATTVYWVNAGDGTVASTAR